MVKIKWALRFPLITKAINNMPVKETSFTSSLYAFAACVNLTGQTFRDNVLERCPEAGMRLYLNMM